MAKESFVFYKSFYDAIKNIPAEEQLKLYNAICEYSFNECIPNLEDGIAKAMFILMKPNIDSATKRYNASVENGRKGGRPKKSKESKEKEEEEEDVKKNLKKPSNNLEETQPKPSNNLNVNDNDNVNDNYNNNYNNIPAKAKELLPSELETQPNYELEFETLWSMYPNKKSKKDALRYYIRARKKGTTYEEVEQGLKAYLNYIKVDKTEQRYIKHGSTWFNQECWNDDYTIEEKQPKKIFTNRPVREEIVPDWLNQKVESKPATPEQIAKMKALLGQE